MPINSKISTASRYTYYRSLIPMSWNYKRDLRINARMSYDTRLQIDQIRMAMDRAKPSDADVIAWAVSLLARHMANVSDPIDDLFVDRLPIL